MIVIPVTKKASWRNPPWITIFLILINIFVFALFQQNDNERWINAETYYYESGLARLEADFYKQYLENQGRTPEDDITSFTPPSDDATEDEWLAYYRFRIENSEDFFQLLENGEVVPSDDRMLANWRSLRHSYEQHRELVVTIKYGFRPAEPRPVTWLTAMFLHGGWGHLIGNMVFLWLVGSLIEYGCRHAVYPGIYLLSGMMATGFYWLLNMHSTIPLVGASGAISGIMGAFAVFYGFRKVHIFINTGFYFNYLKFPAIFLLPLWMASELYQMIFNEGSGVAYAAHLGGLGGGALLALAVGRMTGMLDLSGFESPTEENKVESTVEKALVHMRSLEYDRARPLLEEALADSPGDMAIWRHLYAIDRQAPSSPRFHKTVSQMLTLYCQNAMTFNDACDLFRKYQEIAKPPKLSPDLYIRISNAYIDTNEPGEAERIIRKLLKKIPHLPSLPTALLKLGQKFRQQGNLEKWQQCIRLLNRHYPSANETRIAMHQTDS